MKVKVENWEVSKLIRLRDKINPQPEYQRGEVWKDTKKRLLIDSMLRGIDIPKIYLRKMTTGAFDYEVADGQQRITSIFKFYDGDLILEDKQEKGLNLGKIKNFKVGGKNFEELDETFIEHFNNYKLTIAIVEESSSPEIRTLFGRLQMGSQLNPAEKRNAILSSVGDHIDNFALNHKFFVNSKIPKERYKHQDYLAHVICLIEYNNKFDLKAEALQNLYLDTEVKLLTSKLGLIDNILDVMYNIDQSGGTRIVNKFAFIDIFWFLYRNKASTKTINTKEFSQRFSKFEVDRLFHSKEPKKLIESKRSKLDEKLLYDYILAFNLSGSSTDNIKIRADVFNSVFTKYLV